MVEYNLDKALLLSTFSLVCVLGLGTVLTLVSSPHQDELTEEASPRNIASISPILETRVNYQVPQKNFMATVDLECVGSNKDINSDVRHLRLKGKLCALNTQESQISQVHVVNRSNGYEGTAFYNDKNLDFTTDFLSLMPGKNEIHVSLFTKTGLSKQTLLNINREKSGLKF